MKSKNAPRMPMLAMASMLSQARGRGQIGLARRRQAAVVEVGRIVRQVVGVLSARSHWDGAARRLGRLLRTWRAKGGSGRADGHAWRATPQGVALGAAGRAR